MREQDCSDPMGINREGLPIPQAQLEPPANKAPKEKYRDRLTSLRSLGLALVNSVVFILFAYSFFKPQTTRDWRSFGAFSGFLVALFAEMYGFPLTIYFLAGWLQSTYPTVDWFSHDAGHLLEMIFGWKANPHAGPFHFLSFVFIAAGFFADFRGLEDPLRSLAARRPSNDSGLWLRATSAIRRVHTLHVRISCAMAYASHTRDVSDARRNVRQAGEK